LVFSPYRLTAFRGCRSYLQLALLTFASLAASCGAHAQEASTSFREGAVAALEIISPFRLGLTNLANIDIPPHPPQTLINGSALGLAADGASAAIVLLRTTSKASVQFKANNGATLLAYDPTFLTHKPQSGTSALSVTPVAVGSGFYALALLQSPPSGAAPLYSQPIAISAQPLGGQVYKAALPLAPPPVLFVHGLWGDSSSLSSYYDKLSASAPWSNHPGSLFELTYPGASSFDSSDSVGALRTEVGQILSTAQKSGIVVGRVDAVAHSMGGLLIREYSQDSAYRIARNRFQGALYDIVTLDTPEDGSAMASYLIGHQNDGRKASVFSDFEAYSFWSAVCGTNANTSVGDCLASYGDPIAGGAVASLAPGNAVLQQAPTPHIPGALWSAVTATDSSGLVYDGVTLLIRAIYASESQAPSIFEILGGPNDDIVSLTSQLYDSPSPYVTDPGLAHTALLNAATDPAVTNSPLAISQTACWLQGIALAACPKPNPAVQASESVKASLRAAPGRLEIAAPKQARLGQPLIFRSSAKGIQSLEIGQLILGRTRRAPTEVKPVMLADGGAEFSVTPRLLGQVRFDITANFGDGRFDIVHEYVNVSVDSGRITALRADSQFRELADLDVGSVYFLSPAVQVEGLSKPVEIGPLAVYRIVTEAGTAPPITIDARGALRAVSPGSATIIVTFEGHTDRLSVSVK